MLRMEREPEDTLTPGYSRKMNKAGAEMWIASKTVRKRVARSANRKKKYVQQEIVTQLFLINYKTKMEIFKQIIMVEAKKHYVV
jgi:hypothetical protein